MGFRKIIKKYKRGQGGQAVKGGLSGKSKSWFEEWKCCFHSLAVGLFQIHRLDRRDRPLGYTVQKRATPKQKTWRRSIVSCSICSEITDKSMCGWIATCGADEHEWDKPGCCASPTFQRWVGSEKSQVWLSQSQFAHSVTLIDRTYMKWQRTLVAPLQTHSFPTKGLRWQREYDPHVHKRPAYFPWINVARARSNWQTQTGWAWVGPAEQWRVGKNRTGELQWMNEHRRSKEARAATRKCRELKQEDRRWRLSTKPTTSPGQRESKTATASSERMLAQVVGKEKQANRQDRRQK